MLKLLKTYFTKGNTFYGLKVYQVENINKFHLVEVVKKKGELTITNSQGFDTLQELSKLCKTSIPIYLICNTSDVITKQLDSGSNLKNLAAVEYSFPGLELENFYYQISELKNQLLVSIAKKKSVDAHLHQLKKMDFNVVGFSLGLTSLSTILNYIDSETIYTNSKRITFGSNVNAKFSISKIEESSNVTYTVNGLQIENSALVAFSGVLDFLSNRISHDSNFNTYIQKLQNEFKRNRIFKIIWKSYLVFLLFVLLSNFLFFNFYFNQVDSLIESLTFENENKKNLVTIKNRVSKKERRVDAVLSVSNSRTSYFLDKLGSSIPKSILLDEIQYQPLTKPVQPEKPIELQENIIIVMGNCIDSEDFSSWIAGLEIFEWVQSVETLDYDYKNQNSSTFKIKISVAAL